MLCRKIFYKEHQTRSNVYFHIHATHLFSHRACGEDELEANTVNARSILRRLDSGLDTLSCSARILPMRAPRWSLCAFIGGLRIRIWDKLRNSAAREFLEYTLGNLDRSLESGCCLIGDNCSLNKDFASQLQIPLLGFVRHRFNLAVQDIMENEEYVIRKVKERMWK